MESIDKEEKRANRSGIRWIRRRLKLAVTIAKTIAYDHLYEELKGRGEDTRLFRLAKVKE